MLGAEEFLALAREDRHSDVLKAFGRLAPSDRDKPVVMMAYGDSLYEMGEDVRAIEVYLTFANRFPRTRAAGFALYGAAMAMKNLGLMHEALRLLESIECKENHPELEGHLASAEDRLEKQSSARDLFELWNTVPR